NVISGNAAAGVSINASSTNTVAGNYIGTNAAGDAGLGGQAVGVHILAGASNNTVGGAAPADRHFLAGHSGAGGRIDGGATTLNNVLGNAISGNGGAGVLISAAADNTVAGNTISGSAEGVWLSGGAHDNRVSGNAVTGNSGSGVRIEGAGTDLNVVV